MSVAKRVSEEMGVELGAEVRVGDMRHCACSAEAYIRRAVATRQQILSLGLLKHGIGTCHG